MRTDHLRLAHTVSVVPETPYSKYNPAVTSRAKQNQLPAKKAKDKPDWGTAMMAMHGENPPEMIISIAHPLIFPDPHEGFQICFTDGVHMGSLFASKQQMREIEAKNAPFYKVKLETQSAFRSDSGQEVVPARIVEVLGS